MKRKRIILKKRKLPNVREFPSVTTSTRTSDEENVMSSDSEDESGPTTSTSMEVDETFTASQKEIARPQKRSGECQ